MAHNTITTIQPTRSRGRVHRSRWLLNVATMACAVIAWTIAVPIAGMDLTVTMGGTEQQVTQLAVISTALLAGSAAWGSLTILERVTRRARTIWTWLAALVLILSLTGPLAATSASAGWVLVLLHVVVGALLIVGMPRVGKPQR